MRGRQQRAADALRARLDRTLGSALSRRVVFLPSQEDEAYYRLIALADVVLDAPTFSTSLTGFDAFALGKPIVTLPGELMVQRYALGLYTHMGLQDLAVTTESEYIDLAVRLGQNPDYQQAAQDKILDRCNLLYEDPRVVSSYESFLEQIAQERR